MGPAHSVIEGSLDLTPHPDKAITQRATILAALATGVSKIRNFADCADVRENLSCLRALGVPVSQTSTELVITGDGLSSIGNKSLVLNTGNSATTSRLLLATLSARPCDITVSGNHLLQDRPMAEVIEPLRKLGANVTELGFTGRLPARVQGRQLDGGEVDVRVDSAQPVSALLFAGMQAGGLVHINRETAARDHTERLLRWTGISVEETANRLTIRPGRPRTFDLTVPADPSGAALLAAIHLASPVANQWLVLRGVGVNPRRIGFFDIVEQMGAIVKIRARTFDGPEPVADIWIRAEGQLKGVTIDSRELVQSTIDELPLIAALATVAVGDTSVSNADELRGKDTDRIATLLKLLRTFKCHAEEVSDGFIVKSGFRPCATEVSLPADHRIVFTALVLAVLSGENCLLQNVSAIRTSNPGALEDLTLWAPVEQI